MEPKFSIEPSQPKQPHHEQTEDDNDGATDDIGFVTVLEQQLAKGGSASPENHEDGTEAEHEEQA